VTSTAQSAEATADTLDVAAQRALAPLAAALNSDAPDRAKSAFAAAQMAMREIAGVAGSGAASIKALEVEAATHLQNGLIETSRATALRAEAAKVALREVIGQLADTATTALSVAEAESKIALIPKISTDASARQLARSEIEAATATEKGVGMAGAMGRLVGVDPALDSELLSDWGTRRIAASANGGREGDETVKLFQSVAIQKLAAVAGTRGRTQEQAAKSLALFAQARGAVSAVAAAGRTRGGV
jgi:hypothetical protein